MRTVSDARKLLIPHFTIQTNQNVQQAQRLALLKRATSFLDRGLFALNGKTFA